MALHIEIVLLISHQQMPKWGLLCVPLILIKVEADVVLKISFYNKWLLPPLWLNSGVYCSQNSKQRVCSAGFCRKSADRCAHVQMPPGCSYHGEIQKQNVLAIEVSASYLSGLSFLLILTCVKADEMIKEIDPETMGKLQLNGLFWIIGVHKVKRKWGAQPRYNERGLNGSQIKDRKPAGTHLDRAACVGLSGTSYINEPFQHIDFKVIGFGCYCEGIHFLEKTSAWLWLWCKAGPASLPTVKSCSLQG